MRGSDPDLGSGAQGSGASVFVRRAGTLVGLLWSATALAQATPPPEPEELNAGGLLQVGVADTSSLTPATVEQNRSGTPFVVPALIATIRVGGYFAHHSELSLGLSLAYVQSDSGGSSSSLLDLVVAPTYRYHFSPLKPWSLSPFAEVQVLIGISNFSQSGGGSSTLTPQIGAAAGVGAEYLFGDRFGILIDAGMRYLNYTVSAGSFSFGAGTTINSIQLWGSAAVALHF